MLNMVAPDVAYFGQKDAQQVALVRAPGRPTSTSATRDRGRSPTVREPDGLALSSRNVRLRARASATAAATPR